MDPRPNQHQLLLQLLSQQQTINLSSDSFVSPKKAPLFWDGDPYRIRTDVNGVRGRCLNHLTNGPYLLYIKAEAVISGPPSGTRTLDTLIKSQVL